MGWIVGVVFATLYCIVQGVSDARVVYPRTA